MTEHEQNPQQPNVPSPWSREAPDAGTGPQEPAAGQSAEPGTGSGSEPVTGPGGGPVAGPGGGPATGPGGEPVTGPGAGAGAAGEPGSVPSPGWAEPPTDPGTGFGPGYPHAAGQPGLPHGADPSGYGPPPGPSYPGYAYQGYQPYQGYPGQPYQGQPGYAGQPGYPGQRAPASGGSGRKKGLLAVGAVLALGLAALGGGVAGAGIYAAQSGGSGTNGSDVTQVVDAPQLNYSSLAGIASEVSPSVVEIRAGQAGGSGVVLSEDGHILTNAHVVEADPSGEIAVRFSNGDTVSGTLVGADSRSDIGVIEVDPDSVSDLTPATFGDSSKVLVGDTVLAIGSPLSYSGSVTQGIVSGLNRTLTPSEAGGGYSLSGLLQSDAAINSGNSGGALVNLNGEVVGINTAIATQGQNAGFLGVGFAIPSNTATNVANQLIAGEEVDHPFLGVRVGSNPEGGAVITEVNPGSPAEEAGIQAGDVIVRFGDREITDSGDLVSAVQAGNVGDTVEVELQRDGSTQTTTVTLGDSED